MVSPPKTSIEVAEPIEKIANFVELSYLNDGELGQIAWVPESSLSDLYGTVAVRVVNVLTR